MASPPHNPTDAPFVQVQKVAEEFSRMFAEMKLPAAPDMEAVVNAQRRNMEALSAANKVALDGAQAVAQRHMEIMQQSFTAMGDAMQALSTAEPPQVKAARQAELMKKTYERAVANTQEMADLIQRANAEAVALLNRRVAEALDEVKAMMEKSMMEKPGR